MGQEGGSEGGGIEVVKASLDVKEEGGDPESESLESPDLREESQVCVEGVEPWEGAALVGVQETFGLEDG